MILIVVEKQEPTAAFAAGGIAQRCGILWPERRAPGGEGNRHRSQYFAEIVQEEMQRPQAMVGLIELPIFANGGLKIVGDARDGELVEIGVLAKRVGASVIHIVARQVCAAAQRDNRHCLNALGRNNRAMMIGDLDACAQFAVGKGVARHIIRDAGRWLLVTIPEEKFGGWSLLELLVGNPGCEGVGRVCGQEAVLRASSAYT